MDQPEQRGGGITDRVAKVREGASKRMHGDVAGGSVVSASRERAQAAGRAARSQLPATREDVQRVQASLDRIEAALVHLAAKVDALKPAPRRSASRTAGDAKAKS